MLEEYRLIINLLNREIDKIAKKALIAINHFNPKDFNNREEYSRIHRKIFDERDRRIAVINETINKHREAFKLLARETYKGNPKMLEFWGVERKRKKKK